MRKYYGMLVDDFLESDIQITFSDLANAYQAGQQADQNIQYLIVEREKNLVVHVECLTAKLLELSESGEITIIKFGPEVAYYSKNKWLDLLY